jgi:hypothetical protein
MKRRELMLLTGDQADLDRVADTEDNRGELRPAMTLPALAADLVDRKVDVIATGNPDHAAGA